MPKFFHVNYDWKLYNWTEDQTLTQVKRRDDIFQWLDRFTSKYTLMWSGYINWKDNYSSTISEIAHVTIDDVPEIIEYFMRTYESPNKAPLKFDNDFMGIRTIEIGTAHQYQSTFLCMICMTSVKNCVFLPCKHSHTCKECSEFINRCPYCRADIAEKLSIYN